MTALIVDTPGTSPLPVPFSTVLHLTVYTYTYRYRGNHPPNHDHNKIMIATVICIVIKVIKNKVDLKRSLSLFPIQLDSEIDLT